MLPDKASGMTIHYGGVYIKSPSYPDDERDTWSVWDPRTVWHGAQIVSSGLTFQQAERAALRCSGAASDRDPQDG